MWKFSQLSRKKHYRKITQNKVCICHKLCMYGVSSANMGLVFRKARCLISLKHRINQISTSWMKVEILLSTVSFPVGGGRNIFDVTISNANNNRVSSLAEA